jgi:hypothetical protein
VALFRRPVESAGRTPGAEQERFPGFDVLGQASTWDAVTAGVVLSRLGTPPPLRFFSLAEQAVGTALFDQLLDQREEPKVWILQAVDSRLAEGVTDGWRYEDMPEDGDAFRRSFAGLDQEAHDRYGRRFDELDWYDQADLVQYIQDLSEKSETWSGMNAKHVWSLWTRYACAAFYAHPFAWNEMGFGGPAYPRGYKNLGVDALEPWEVRDVLDRDPIGWGERLENARRRHAAVRSDQLSRRHPEGGPQGIGEELAEMEREGLPQ